MTAAPPGAVRSGAGPVVLRYALILAIAPYLGLKVLWVAGVMVGVPETSPAYQGWRGPNLATLGMDLVAVLLALAFTQRWGLRLPGWLVVVPAWFGAGFLVPAVVQVPIGFGYSLLTTGRPVRMPDGLVEDWAYTVVYSSFAVQGALLTVAFAGYARRRGWLRPAGPDRVLPLPSAVSRPLMVFAITGAVLAAVVAALRLYAAGAGPAGWRVGGWPVLVRLGTGVEGLLAVGAVVGILALLLSRPARWISGPAAVALAFTGSGTLVAYGLLRTGATLGRLPMSELTGPVLRLGEFAAVLAGTVVGSTGAVLLGTRMAPRPGQDGR